MGSLNKSNLTQGVMNSDYAYGRHSKMHMKFRYMVRARVAANAIIEYLNQSEKPYVLDLGSADGRTLLEIRNIVGNGKYTGIEFSMDLIQFAKDLPAEIQTVIGDVTNLPITRGSLQIYNVVTGLAILEHLRNPGIVVRQAYNVLKPGGIFIATCPDPIWDKISNILLHNQLSEHHVNNLYKKDLLQVVKHTGFEVIKSKRFMWAPVGIIPYLQIWIDPKFAVKVDHLVHHLRIFNELFVNMLVIARKP